MVKITNSYVHSHVGAGVTGHFGPPQEILHSFISQDILYPLKKCILTHIQIYADEETKKMNFLS